MNKYSRQLRIGRVFVRRASSGRKYAILADFTQCLVTQCLTLFCRLLSPFLRCRTGFFALRKSPFHVAIWYVRHRHTGNTAVRKSLFRPPSSHFSPSVSPKTPSRHPFSRSITHISHHIRSSFPIFHCQYFLLLKMHKYTFLHRSTVPSVSLFPFSVAKPFCSRKRINIHSLTLSPPHPLTLLYIFPSFPVPSFPFFTSLIFYPFTSFTFLFTSLIFTLLLLKTLFSLYRFTFLLF